MKKITIDIEQNHITLICASIFLLGIILFTTGYFLGKKTALEDFAEQIKNESFSDKVYTSLCSLYDYSHEQEKNNDNSHEVSLGEPIDELESLGVRSPEDMEPVVLREPSPLYRAQLIGFGSCLQAQEYAQSLQERGIKVEVKERHSTSSRGKKRIWYQVVSLPTPYEEVQALAARLQASDRLAGVVFVKEKDITVQN